MGLKVRYSPNLNDRETSLRTYLLRVAIVQMLFAYVDLNLDTGK